MCVSILVFSLSCICVSEGVLLTLGKEKRGCTLFLIRVGLPGLAY